jgi:hypothetical protein
VLNATDRAGLATRAAATLRSAGWSVASTGNYRQAQPPSTEPPSTEPPSTEPPSTEPPSTVYYSTTELRATARAVSEDLPGAQRVERSTSFGDAVTVVLGPDYSG